VKTGPALLSDTSNILTLGSLTAGASKSYELRLWLTEEATIAEANKRYFGKIKVEASQEEYSELGFVYERLFDGANLGTNCTTYNDGTDTFLVGQCSNNYVWYSGKLWRVVLKNNQTGAVKMVTDNTITAIPYNASGNTAFANSYVDQWLNQEFLPTLHHYQDYLVVNSVWDATTDSSSTPAKPNATTTVERAVGLLNAYEYYTTSASSGYLNSGVYWWLMTPQNASNVRYVYYDGFLDYNTPTKGYGVRPSVNLKLDIQVDSGSGSKSNPYILKGDIQEAVAGTTLLSTRYSGEYVTFNNELYRIVGVENGLTKITAVDKPSSLTSNVFHTAAGVTSFANANIYRDLETYYRGELKATNRTAFNMIESNTTWYLGGVGSGDNFGNYHYKASICASVDTNTSTLNCTKTTTTATASIALPRVGEMFTSQITRGTKDYFWTLTPYSTSSVRIVDRYGNLTTDTPTYDNGARPSMYLKSNIVIASNNTGNGTYEYPYSLQIGS